MSQSPDLERRDRFTISDYYALDVAAAVNAKPKAPSPVSPQAQAPQPSPVRVAGPLGMHVPTPPAAPAGPGPSRSKPPTITTTSSSPGSAPRTPHTPGARSPPTPAAAAAAENSDYFGSRWQSSPRASPDPVMAHPLGPGPQPHPASPDGNTSDTEDYVPELTYPPKGYYGAQKPTAPTQRHPSPPSGRDLQHNLATGNRALHSPQSPPALTSAAPGAFTQRLLQQHRQQTMSPTSTPSSLGPTSPGITSPSLAVHPGRPGYAERQLSLSPGVGPGAHSPSGMSELGRGPSYTQPSPYAFEDEKDPMEKDVPPLPTTSRALGTHGPSAHSRAPSNSVLRDWFPKSWPCRLLLLVVFLEAVIDIAIQANILWRFSREWSVSAGSEKRLPVYLYIFVSAHIVQFGLTIWAIRTRNTIQLIGLALFNVLFLIYAAAVETSELRNNETLKWATQDGVEDATNFFTLPINVLTSVSISIIAASVVAVIVLTYFVWREFGWDIYRSLGADLRIRGYYFQYQVYESIICFSFFFFAGFGVQFALLVLGDKTSDPEYIITWVMLPVLLLWLIMGLTAARLEWAAVMGIYLVGILAGTAYFVFKLVRIWTRQDEYLYVQKSLTIFSVLSLIMIILNLAYGVIVWRNFGKGLRQSLDSRRKERKAEHLALSETNTASTQKYPSHRLTID